MFNRILCGLLANNQRGSPASRISRVLVFVDQNPGCARKDIVDRLRVRPGTITSIVGQMVRDGILVEKKGSGTKPRVGRPEIGLYVNTLRYYIVSISAISRNFVGARVYWDGEIEGFRKWSPTGCGLKIADEHCNQELLTVGRDLKEGIQDLIKSGPEKSECLGIVFFLPGAIDKKELIVYASTRWGPSLSLTPIANAISLPVYLKKDLDVRLDYLMSQGQVGLLQSRPELANKHPKGEGLKELEQTIRNTATGVLLHWGYGIGASVAINGKVLQTTSRSLMEIGHWKLDLHDQTACLCGEKGCVETRAALWALVPYLQRDFDIGQLEEDSLYAFFETTDVLALDYMRNALEKIALILGNLNKMVYPQIVYLQGPFFKNRKIMACLEEILHKNPDQRTTAKEATYTVYQQDFPCEMWWSGIDIFREKIKTYFDQLSKVPPQRK